MKKERDSAREGFGLESESGRVRWYYREDTEEPHAVHVIRVFSAMVKRLSTKDGKVFK